MSERVPKIGVGVIVVKNGKILVGLRKHSHGSGTWQFPGGHLEFGESVVQCAIREAMEETGIEVENARPVTFVENLFPEEQKHYVTLYVVADWKGGEPEAREPEKSGEWGWFAWEALPRPLFAPIEKLVKQGFSPLP